MTPPTENSGAAVSRWSPTSASGGSSCATKPDDVVGLHPEKASRLWLWFVAAFLLQLAAWTVWFVIASQHRVAEVPLATSR